VQLDQLVPDPSVAAGPVLQEEAITSALSPVRWVERRL